MLVFEKLEQFQLFETEKSELTELFRARDASCPKGKKMEHRKSLTKSVFDDLVVKIIPLQQVSQNHLAELSLFHLPDNLLYFL